MGQGISASGRFAGECGLRAWKGVGLGVALGRACHVRGVEGVRGKGAKGVCSGFGGEVGLCFGDWIVGEWD